MSSREFGVSQYFIQGAQAFPMFDGKIAEMFQCLLMSKTQKKIMLYFIIHIKKKKDRSGKHKWNFLVFED